MSHELTPEEQAKETRREIKETNERRVDALLELNNRYVRTQRHLEQHSNISGLDQLKHNFKLQEERENQIDNLKDIIVYGDHDAVDQKANLERNIEYTDNYLKHHASDLDDATLQRTQEKQEHRKEQLKHLK